MGSPKISDGLELTVSAVHRLDEARAESARCRAALDQAVAAERQAEERLRQLLAVGHCSDETHPSPEVPRPPTRAASLVDDKRVAKQWRVAFALLESDRLDYAETARRIWGAGMDAQTIKNRVSSALHALKQEGIIKRVGRNQYQVDRTLLAKRTGKRVPEEASS